MASRFPHFGLGHLFGQFFLTLGICAFNNGELESLFHDSIQSLKK